MNTLVNYRHYRSRGFSIRHAIDLATHSAGFTDVIAPFLRGAVIAALVLGAYTALSRKADAAPSTKNDRQEAYTKQLESLLAKCLSPGDNAISIGGELFFCGAAATGVLLK